MKSYLIPITLLILILASLITLKNQVTGLTSQRTDIDELEELLKPVNKIVPAKKHIVFDSNCTEGEDQFLYYTSQFVIAPIVLQNRDPVPGDTVLQVEKNFAKDSVQPQATKNIFITSKETFRVKLYVKQ